MNCFNLLFYADSAYVLDPWDVFRLLKTGHQYGRDDSASNGYRRSYYLPHKQSYSLVPGRLRCFYSRYCKPRTASAHGAIIRFRKSVKVVGN